MVLASFLDIFLILLILLLYVIASSAWLAYVLRASSMNEVGGNLGSVVEWFLGARLQSTGLGFNSLLFLDFFESSM